MSKPNRYHDIVEYEVTETTQKKLVKELRRYEKLTKDEVLDFCNFQMRGQDEDEELTSSCICGRPNIRYLNYVRSKITGREYIIGSRCINSFAPKINCIMCLKLTSNVAVDEKKPWRQFKCSECIKYVTANIIKSQKQRVEIYKKKIDELNENLQQKEENYKQICEKYRIENSILKTVINELNNPTESDDESSGDEWVMSSGCKLVR